MLSPDDFAAFFEEVHDSEPFPWQQRLLRRVADEGRWPATMALPTGSGKTSAIDIAVFHLALEAARVPSRRAPVRIAFVVDRRLVVDDAFEHAARLADAITESTGPITARVREQLKTLSGDGPALVARRLRGGIPLEVDWARTPSQPTVLCSTVDQIGSRLLFRGYGVSDSMKPVHAGLIGSDCLILLDEAHLAEPFRQTLGWVHLYQGQKWRQVESPVPWGFALLTATPGEASDHDFRLEDEDRNHPVLSRRLNASKPTRLVASSAPKPGSHDAAGREDAEPDADDLDRRVAAITNEVRRAYTHFKAAAHGVSAPAIGVVVNRVARARLVFEHLHDAFKEEIEQRIVDSPILLIGPARPFERELLGKRLEAIHTRSSKTVEPRTLDKTLLIVATQCIEAGVDIDLDALVTEAAPVDALRQRFGRLNRAGRPIVAYAAVVAAKSDLSSRYDDPVYADAIKPAWDYLSDKPDGRQDGVAIVDFGLNAFGRRMADAPIPSIALSPKDDAPILLPAQLDLLSQTSPIPRADPDVALYLHGPMRQPDSITVVWRADVEPETEGRTRRLLLLVPPRAQEAIELPAWAVHRWSTRNERSADRLADVAAVAPDGENRRTQSERRSFPVFRWKGDDERSTWIESTRVLPGDTIVVRASDGGVDEFGWNPRSTTDVTDIARNVAESFAGRRFTIRIAPGLLDDRVTDEALADALTEAASRHWRDLRNALLDLDLPDTTRSDLHALDRARKGKVVPYLDLYGFDDRGRPRGMIFVAPFGLEDKQRGEGGEANATENDVGGSLPGFFLTLDVHCEDVAEKARAFAKPAGLPPTCVDDMTLAASLHDAGKADARFQGWLHYGDPLRGESAHVLAKSARPLPRAAREESGLPERWRHEAQSVRRLRADERFSRACDGELVMWLVGTHHGHGRPFFPHHDPMERPPDVGPQSLAFDWQGVDWPTLFEQLKARYGTWELARLEAILRLADHRASEEERAAAERSE